jgi:hypothetical protein
LLVPYDVPGLLNAPDALNKPEAKTIDDDTLLAELGATTPDGGDDITVLKHVASHEEKRAAEEIANRTPCAEFAAFKPLFDQVKRDLDQGARTTREFQRTAEIKQGESFIVGGQIAYVAELGDEFVTEYDRKDRRLRVIYDSATERNVLAAPYKRRSIVMARAGASRTRPPGRSLATRRRPRI